MTCPGAWAFPATRGGFGLRTTRTTSSLCAGRPPCVCLCVCVCLWSFVVQLACVYPPAPFAGIILRFSPKHEPSACGAQPTPFATSRLKAYVLSFIRLASQLTVASATAPPPPQPATGSTGTGGNRTPAAAPASVHQPQREGRSNEHSSGSSSSTPVAASALLRPCAHPEQQTRSRRHRRPSAWQRNPVRHSQQHARQPRHARISPATLQPRQSRLWAGV